MTTAEWRNANPLRVYRTERGMSQFRAAEHLDVHPQSIQNWEFGRSTPSLAYMRVIAQMMVVTRDTLDARWSRWLERKP